MKKIWLLQVAEDNPADPLPRPQRTGTLAEELCSQGYDVTWFTSRFNHSRKVHREAVGLFQVSPHFSLYLLDAPSYYSNVGPARILHNSIVALRFLRTARTLPKPDLIVACFPSPELSAAGARYAQKHNVPFVVDVRDPWPDVFASLLPRALKPILTPFFLYYRSLLRFSLTRANLLVSVSKSLLEWARGYLNRPIPTQIIPLGFTLLYPLMRNTNPGQFSESTPLKCVFSGVFGNTYDGDTIIAAARLLRDLNCRSVNITMIGDGELRDRWTAAAQDLPNVKFTGWLKGSDLSREIASAHVGIIPIRGEMERFWMGNKLYEYLAHGLAIVNNTSGEVAQIIENERLGKNYLSGDAASLARCLQELSQEPAELTNISIRALQTFESRFSSGKVFQDYVNCLTGMLAEQGSSVASVVTIPDSIATPTDEILPTGTGL